MRIDVRKLLALVGFIFTNIVSGTPIHLSITPRGPTQAAITISPVAPYTDSVYEILVRTNSLEGRWINIYSCVGNPSRTISAVINLKNVRGLTTDNLQNWTFVAGYGGDTDGNLLSDIYEDLVSRTDPYAGADPYSCPMNDGWTYFEKMQRGMDPYLPYPPPPPRLMSCAIRENTNSSIPRSGIATLTWTQQGHVEYFIVERANRTLRRTTNNWKSSWPPTNRPPHFPPSRRYPPYEDTWITGPSQVVAKIPAQPGVQEYHFSQSNVDTFFQPLYRVQCHFSTNLLHAYLDKVNTAIIRHTLIPVIAQPSTNGYDLSVQHPIRDAYYLLLVRDKNNPQWRASGYFTSGTNRGPVLLHVDTKGMMSDGQRPLAMPPVKCVPVVDQPEFVAGWGEDSDEDGLPDAYEVLVTKTEPDKTDTGNTGIIDGYKEFAADGWSNLEKFRRRLNPFQPVVPPQTVELNKPTLMEITKASVLLTDLHYESHFEIRTNGGFVFQPLTNFSAEFYRNFSRDPRNARGNFDLRVSWSIPEPHPHSDW